MDLIGKMTKKPNRNEHIRAGARVTVFQSGKRGHYNADFYFKGHRTMSLKTTNQTIAIRKAKLIDAQLENGTFTLNERKERRETDAPKALKDAMNEYLAVHRTDGNRHKTVRRYEGILTTFLAFAEAREITNVEQVNLVFIDNYRAHRKGTLSPRSMHNEGRLIKNFLSFCEDREYIDRNPLYKKKFVPPKPKIRKAPTLVQVNALLKNASKIRFPPFALLSFTGVRVGECRNLRVEDVDFEHGWVHIESRKGYETKNGESRKVPLHPRLRKILESLPRNRSGWFFTALPSKKYPQGGHHLSTKKLNEDFKEVLAKLEIPVGRDDGFTIHSLRRFFKTTAINSGVPERIVDLWAGHADSRSMGTIYYGRDDEVSQNFMSKVKFDEESPSTDTQQPSDSKKENE